MRADGLTAAENVYQGFTSALATDQGWLVNATYSQITGQASIWYGVDRQKAGIDSPNPLVWHGPEIQGNQDLFVWKMRATTLGAAGGMRLWIAATPGASAGGPWLGYVSVPVNGSPIQDLAASGVHRFATGSGSGAWNATSSIRSMPLSGADKGANKIIHTATYGTRGLDVASGTKLTTYLRGDPAVGSTSWGTGSDVTVDPTTSVTPATTTAGHKIEWRANFVSPSGTATPAKVGLLDAVRIEWWRIVTAFRVYTLDVEIGDHVYNRENGTDATKSPEEIVTLLKALTEAGKTTLRLPDDSRWSIKLRQVLDIQHTYGSGTYGQTMRCRLQVALIAPA